jgi:hypothetical protein
MAAVGQPKLHSCTSELPEGLGSYKSLWAGLSKTVMKLRG